MMAADKLHIEMTLAELMQGMVEIPDEMDCTVHGITLDSRQVKKGFVFLACKGLSVNGVDFIDDAIARGAVAVIWQSDSSTTAVPFSYRNNKQGEAVPLVAVDGLNMKAGKLADRYYGEPSKIMSVTGITGTNGKTSCSYYLAQVLSDKKAAAVIGTLGYGTLDDIKASTHTTPDVVTCHQWLSELQSAGVKNVAMEVSSHALDQGRVNGIHFDYAVFTNLTRDHLDYHGDMLGYLQAKEKLFFWPGLKTAVINADDEAGRQLLMVIPSSVNVLSYGMKIVENNKPDIFASSVEMKPDGMAIKLETPQGKGSLVCQLLGRFNVSNLLAVLGVLLARGMRLETALERLARVQSVAGRMQCIKQQNTPLTVIDYAHTPDALQQTLQALREHAGANIWCVFGCGGDRDKGKRPVMGEIAEQFASKVVLTSDNPRNEDPQQIIDEIISGIKQPGKVIVEPDRQNAIRYAIQHAAKDDVVLIAGKGHETYQEIDGIRYPFSDEKIVRQVMEENV